MTLRLLAMGGDGIGLEVLDSALKVLDVVASSIGLQYDLSEDLLHGAAWEKFGTFIRPETLDKARHSDALLIGAVGGPQWDNIEIEGGPAEQDGLMKLRSELDVFACVRSAKAWDALIPKTPYRAECVRNADVIVMRELCGGAMFSETRGVDVGSNGIRRGFDLNEYTDWEIERFARISFEIARRRKSRVVSVDKSNVFIADKLWREVVDEVSKDYPDVELTHYFTDNCAYQLCRQPTAFDVILADNLFGDLLSDLVGAIAGSLGMLPSASLPNLPANGVVEGPAIYEPVHGSAPDITGQGIANPIGMILSLAMMLEYGAGRTDTAEKVNAAVNATLNDGVTTPDIGGDSSTDQVTDAVIRHFRLL